MNELCDISTVKSSIGDLPLDAEFVRQFERLLTLDAGLARSKARLIIGGYKSLLQAKLDAGGEVAVTPPDAELPSLADDLRRLTEAFR